MQKKQVAIIPRGIQQDISVGQFPADAAYEIRNMRLITTGDNTSLCLVNEKSNKKSLTLDGIVLGTQIIDDYVIVFTHNNNVEDKKDSIIKLSIKDNLLVSQNLFNGYLGFELNNPIESIGIYETENIQKVYWVDGINQPRVINVSEKGIEKLKKDDNYQFDFLPQMNLSNSNSLIMEVSKAPFSNGNFPAGVIQYAVSYFNLYGQQTGIIYQSPLLYTSTTNRGLSPESKSSDVFKIKIDKPDTSFEYVRLYRITRTSIDATPTVEIVGDYKTNSSYENEVVTRKELISKPNVTNSGKIKSIRHSYTTTGKFINAFSSEFKDLNRVFLDPDVSTAFIIDNTTVDDKSKDLIIEYEINNKTCFYTIPKNESVKVQWAFSTEQYGIKEEIGIYLAKKVGQTWYIKEDSILRGIEKVQNAIITYDTGTTGSIVDPTELLYLGGEIIAPSTITHKDNTMFLGNIHLKRETISDDIKEYIKNNSGVFFDYKDMGTTDRNSELNTQYNYKSSLDKSSKEITFFQKGEVYRVGVQFLSKVGTWSEVVYLGDFKNDKRVIPNVFNDDISSKPIINTRVSIHPDISDYIGARLVCVYPNENERNVVCQGLVLPTVYNISDRLDNSPYVQSSWFARPYKVTNVNSPTETMLVDRNKLRGYSLQSNMVEYDGVYLNGATISTSKIAMLPSAAAFNSEVQYSSYVEPSFFKSPIHSSLQERQSKLGTAYNNFGVDTTIVTFHSPEIDDKYSDGIYNMPMDKVKFRIVGYVPLKTNFSDLNLEHKNPYKPNVSSFHWSQIKDSSGVIGGNNYISGKSLVGINMWIDSIYGYTTTYKQSFPIYPWHRSGSLNNQGKEENADNRKSVLTHKIMSNLRIGMSSAYFPDYYDKLTISNVELFNSDQIEVRKLKVWGKEINYYGNIDKILSVKSNKDFPIYFGNDQESNDEIELIKGKNTVGYYTTKAVNPWSAISDNHSYSSDPISIKYKSSPHAVFAFEKNSSGEYMMLPRLSLMEPNDAPIFSISRDNMYSYPLNESIQDTNLIWENPGEIFRGLCVDRISVNEKFPSSVDTYYFLLGELYRENVVNRFGGNSKSALENNIWVPCGDTVYFNSGTENVYLIGDQGDTYYQRYDHLKTYPFTNADTNSIVDIVSFCCETRINIDGRYDRNRGNQSNVAISPINFNLYNKVYSQRSNFFTYKSIDSTNFSSNKFPTQVTWTKTKTLGESIDTWTHVTLASIMDLDGDKGELNALRRLNNEIYAFQDSGISRINFNARVQINASDGVPIEIANSGKVDGKVYLTDKYGCHNKWSIVETPSGFYFVDDFNKCILSLGSQGINDLSYTKNMFSWISKNVDNSIWTLLNKKAIRTIYDKNTSDIYFTTDKEALSFNEKLGAFSGFYNYENVGWLFNLEGKSYQIRTNDIWQTQGGIDYNIFFGESKEYKLSVISNSEFQVDKIFDTIEFRTNGIEHFEYNKAETYPFTKLTTENEYQKAISNTSNLKKKFRNWRWQVGRNISNRDRIRNPWAKVTLLGDSKEEVRLYDMAITYYI